MTLKDISNTHFIVASYSLSTNIQGADITTNNPEKVQFYPKQVYSQLFAGGGFL